MAYLDSHHIIELPLLLDKLFYRVPTSLKPLLHSLRVCVCGVCVCVCVWCARVHMLTHTHTHEQD